MKRGQVTQFIIAGLIILILLINGNVNADKKGCEKATDLAEQSAKNNIEGYKTIRIKQSQTEDTTDFLRLLGKSEDEQEIINKIEKARIIIMKDEIDKKGATLFQLKQTGFSEDGMKGINLETIPDKIYIEELDYITGIAIEFGNLNIRKSENLYNIGKTQDIKGAKKFYNYAIDENNGLIKIYEELIKRIEGSRSVVINDAVKYAEHTKQIKKLQNEINNIKELQRKYK